MIMEFIFEIVFEGILELATNKKVSKWLRYPFIALLIGGYIAIIILILFLAFNIIQDNILTSLLLFFIGIILIVMGILFWRKKIR